MKHSVGPWPRARPLAGGEWIAWIALAVATAWLAIQGPTLDAGAALASAAGRAQLEGSAVGDWLHAAPPSYLLAADPKHRPPLGGLFPALLVMLESTLGLGLAWLLRAGIVLASATLLLGGTARGEPEDPVPSFGPIRLLSLGIALLVTHPRAPLDAFAVDAPALLLLLLAAERDRWRLGFLVTTGWLALVPTAWPLALVVVAPALARGLRSLRENRSRDGSQPAYRLGDLLGPLGALVAVLAASTLARGAALAPWLSTSERGAAGPAVWALLLGGLAATALAVADRRKALGDAWWLAGAWLLTIAGFAAAPLLALPGVGRRLVGSPEPASEASMTPRVDASTGPPPRPLRFLALALAVLLPGVGLGWNATWRALDEGSMAAPRLAMQPFETVPVDGVAALLAAAPGRVLEAPEIAGRLASMRPAAMRKDSAQAPADAAEARLEWAMTPLAPRRHGEPQAANGDSLEALRARSAFHSPVALGGALSRWRPDHIVVSRSQSGAMAAWLESLTAQGATPFRLVGFDDDLVLFSRRGPALEHWNPAALGRTLAELADEPSRLPAADRELATLAASAPSPLVLRLRAELARLDDRPNDALSLLDQALDRVPSGRAVPHEIRLAQARVLRSADRAAEGARLLRGLAWRGKLRALPADGQRVRAVEQDTYVREQVLALERAGMEAAAGNSAAALAAFYDRYGRFAIDAPATALRRAAAWADDAGDARAAERLHAWADWKDAIGRRFDAARAMAQAESPDPQETSR